ncbi:MAG: DUF5672 family protein [Chitinophagaceae bacterium]
MQDRNKKEVLVLVMCYRSSLSEYEQVSLKQCINVLGNHPIHIVKPVSLNISAWPIDFDRIALDTFDDRFFRDIGAYSRLLLSKQFYQRYIDYKYILIYQLDAFVFRDSLSEWCSKDFDYIGAPWFENFSHTNTQAPFIHGGNGGFSLRKIDSHLKVLNSFSYISRPAENWKKRTESRPAGIKIFHEAAGYLLDLTIRNNTFWRMNSFRGFEDQFWCLVASRNFSWFKIPGYREALDFAFEMQPRRMFAVNDNRLPFGCHAWWKYDLEFWKPFINEYGYELKENQAVSN